MPDFLADPWTFEFMQRAILAAILVSISTSIIGSFIILKGMAFIGDSIPHASFGGVAIAFTIGINPQIGAAVSAIFSALTIGFIARQGSLKYDTAIGIVYITMFAIGVLLFSSNSGFTVDVFGFVFGNVLGISWTNVWVTIAISAFVIISTILFYKELLFTSYDPSMAAANGLPVNIIRYGLLLLIGLTVVAALQVMGIVLVLAMLIAPPATAQLITRRLSSMMAVAAFIGALSSFIGLYVAWHGDVSASASIVLTTTTFFAAALAITFIKSLIANNRNSPWWRQRPAQ